METNEPEGFLNYFRINLNYSKLFTSAIRNSLKWTFWRFYSLFWANAESDPFFYKININIGILGKAPGFKKMVYFNNTTLFLF
jgi:hypothetical protein